MIQTTNNTHPKQAYPDEYKALVIGEGIRLGLSGTSLKRYTRIERRLCEIERLHEHGTWDADIAREYARLCTLYETLVLRHA